MLLICLTVSGSLASYFTAKKLDPKANPGLRAQEIKIENKNEFSLDSAMLHLEGRRNSLGQEDGRDSEAISDDGESLLRNLTSKIDQLSQKLQESLELDDELRTGQRNVSRFFAKIQADLRKIKENVNRTSDLMVEQYIGSLNPLASNLKKFVNRTEIWQERQQELNSKLFSEKIDGLSSDLKKTITQVPARVKEVLMLEDSIDNHHKETVAPLFAQIKSTLNKSTRYLAEQSNSIRTGYMTGLDFLKDQIEISCEEKIHKFIKDTEMTQKNHKKLFSKQLKGVSSELKLNIQIVQDELKEVMNLEDSFKNQLIENLSPFIPMIGKVERRLQMTNEKLTQHSNSLKKAVDRNFKASVVLKDQYPDLSNLTQNIVKELKKTFSGKFIKTSKEVSLWSKGESEGSKKEGDDKNSTKQKTSENEPGKEKKLSKAQIELNYRKKIKKMKIEMQVVKNLKDSKIGSWPTFLSLKTPQTYLIGTFLNGLKLFKNNTLIYSEKLEGNQCRYTDVMYIESMDSFIFYANRVLYQKTNDENPPIEFFKPIHCAERGSCFKFTKIHSPQK